MDSRFDGFSVNLFFDEDGDWLAHLVELPEISAFADTPDQALKELSIVWQGIKKSYLEDNEPVPVAPKRNKYYDGWELKNYQALNYSRLIEGMYKKDGSFYWVAWIEELPECQAIGKTYTEAMQNLNTVFDDYIEILLKSEINIPMPKQKDIRIIKEEPSPVNLTETAGISQEEVILESSSKKISDAMGLTMPSYKSDSLERDFAVAAG